MGGGGGGGPQYSESTVTQQSIPKELMPYAQNMLARGEALTDINQNPYQQYQGQRFAGINPMQQQGYEGISNLGPAGQLGMGTNLAGIASMGSMMQDQFGNQQAQQYMSPYIQNVLDVQKNEAMRDYARQLPGMSAAATRAGGLGGSRGAIAQAEAQRNLQNSMQGIQAKGMQDAYSAAQQQYNNDRTRQLQGYSQALQGANTLGQLGSTQFDQQARAAQSQSDAGTQLRGIEQEELAARYQDFVDQQNLPYQQLGFMSDLIHGTPTAESGKSIYRAPPSAMGQAAGLMGGLGSLYMAGKKG
jgi:hypothetical protein